MNLFRVSVLAVIRSPMSWIAMLLGAFSLFNLVRLWFGFDLAGIILQLNEIYRSLVDGFFDFAIGWVGISLSEKLSDIFVLWFAIGRALSRSYILIKEELLGNPALEYAGFDHYLIHMFAKMKRALGGVGGDRFYRLGRGISALFIAIFWPIFIWKFLMTPTVQLRASHRVYTGGTPHLSDRSKIELPPIGDELKPKFSKETVSYSPTYNARYIFSSYLIIPVLLMMSLLVGNVVLAKF